MGNIKVTRYLKHALEKSKKTPGLDLPLLGSRNVSTEVTRRSLCLQESSPHWTTGGAPTNRVCKPWTRSVRGGDEEKTSTTKGVLIEDSRGGRGGRRERVGRLDVGRTVEERSTQRVGDPRTQDDPF